MSLELRVSLSCYGEPETIINPDDNDIVRSISMVERTIDKEGKYVILARSEMTYMQTDTVMIEHQEGSLDYHYRCSEGYVSLEETSDLFISYARGEDWWKTAVEWELM